MLKLSIPFAVIAVLTAASLQSGPVRLGNLGRDFRTEATMDVSAIRQEMRAVDLKAGSTVDAIKRMVHDLRYDRP